jgi:hypothetical protein
VFYLFTLMLWDHSITCIRMHAFEIYIEPP